MTALVTGSNGFLGGATVERLLVRGEKGLRCFVRSARKPGRLQELAAKHPEARLELVEGSLGTPDRAAEAIRGASTVYHLAAAMSGSPADMFLNTVVASKNLLEAVVAAPKAERPRLVLVSSFGVYGVADLPRGARVDEDTPLETHPERRDLYSQAKLRQERLFWDYAKKHDLDLVVLRPGVIYGPGGNAFSSRVGMSLFGVFLHLGGKNQLPLAYVENCADAIAIAGRDPKTRGQAYNVHDDDLPTCAEYLAGYRREVRKVRSLRIPYPALQGLSAAVERYHAWSKGQLPAIFTPYKTATSWKGNTFTNAKLKGLGWRPLVSTAEGLRRTYAYLREAGK